MVGTSKILTVSYGTFSCTLEGFEDPFGEMRAIAEYFRDLAAEDRYFGAEPPKLDTETLGRITQGEPQKRIVAKVDDTGVVVDQEEAAPSEPVPTAESRKQKRLREKAGVKAAAKARVLDEPPAPSAQAESIAAKMSRIRAAVARSAASEGYSEDQPASWAGLRPISTAFVDVAPADEPDAAPAVVAAPMLEGPESAPAYDRAGDSDPGEDLADDAFVEAEHSLPDEADQVADEAVAEEWNEAAEDLSEEAADLAPPEAGPEADTGREVIAQEWDAAADARDPITPELVAGEWNEADEDLSEEAADLAPPEAVPEVDSADEAVADEWDAAFDTPDPITPEVVAGEWDEADEDLSEEAADLAQPMADTGRETIAEEWDEAAEDLSEDIAALARLDGVPEVATGAEGMGDGWDEVDRSAADEADAVAEDASDLAPLVGVPEEAAGADQDWPVGADVARSADADLAATVENWAVDAADDAPLTEADEADDWTTNETGAEADATVDDSAGVAADGFEPDDALDELDAHILSPDAARPAADDTVAEDLSALFDRLGRTGAAETPAPAQPEAVAPRLVRARIVKMKKSDFDRAVQPDAEIAEGAADEGTSAADFIRSALAGGLLAPAAEVADEAAVPEPAPAPVDAIADQVVAEADEAEVRAQVSRILASQEPSSPALSLSDTFADDDEADENLFAGDPGTPSSLSEADEAELREELAEVEREVAETRKARDGKSVLAAHRSAESSVTRILRETESQLDDSAASRRRATIAHLKAAVAATRADRDDEGEADDDVDLGRYRDDLDRVVRPRRPGDGRTLSTPRRLAPLMLVSEQRIDLPNSDGGGDVRPRRITTGNLALIDDADDETDLDDAEADDAGPIAVSIAFADYAARMGAVELIDLLEAAAAYSAYVEGRPSFSRPGLMKQVGGYNFSREEGLRAFGTLLRQGKIQKLKRGQFAIARTSRFRPESPGR